MAENSIKLNIGGNYKMNFRPKTIVKYSKLSQNSLKFPKSKMNILGMKLDEAVISVGMGVVSGRIGGSGANEKMVLTNTSKSAKQAIVRESRRANQQYAQKAISATISSRNNMFASTAWTSSLRFAAGSGIANGFTVGYSALGFFPDAPAWKPW